ncbi:MAG: Hsp20/alpha crystallin family protein [Phycisphaerae bacterium]
MKSLIKRVPNSSLSSNEDKKRWLKRPDLSNVLPRFRQDMDAAFERMWRNMQMSWPKPAIAWPAIDIDEDDKFLRVRVDTPGVNPKDVEVELSGNLLTIRGSRESQRSENKGSVHHHERISGSFYRTIPLPEYVDASKIEARYDKGVLNIQLPKMPGHGPRKIQVTS